MTIVSAVPFTLQNGTIADATQVMADFNSIKNDVNANAAHNGANNDITSLSGLTTPLSVAQGGTGSVLGAGLILLASGTVSAAATLDIVLTAYTAFRGLKFVLSGFLPATDNTQLLMQFSTNGGVSYDAGAGAYGYDLIGEGAFAAGTSTAIPLAVSAVGGDVGNASNEGANVEVDMFNQTSTAFNTRIQYHSAWMDNTATSKIVMTVGSGARLTAQDTDAVRFKFDTGNIAAGNYAVYGLA